MVKMDKIGKDNKLIAKENSSRSTYYEYDNAGNLIKETDCNGNSITYEYDSYEQAN